MFLAPVNHIIVFRCSAAQRSEGSSLLPLLNPVQVVKGCTKRIFLLFSHCIPFGVGKSYLPFGIGKYCTRESLQKMTATDLSARSHWRGKVVYLQKHSVNSFYKFKFIFSDFIHSSQHNTCKHQDARAQVVCLKPEQTRTISCPILAFSAGLLSVGGDRVGFGHFLTCEFCLFVAL